MRKRIGVTLLMLLAAAVWTLAGDDPMLGSWKLDVAKSKFGAGPTIQAETN